MTVTMAEREPPVSHNFLGIDSEPDAAIKQPQPSGVLRRSKAGIEDGGEADTSRRPASRSSGQFEISAPEMTSPPLSSPFPASSDPSSGAAETWIRGKGGPGTLQHHGVKSAFYKPELENKSIKKRGSPTGRESLQERLQMSVEALENSRPQKVAKVELKDDKGKGRSAGSSADELRLSMNPPRTGGKGVLVHTPKPEHTSRIPVKPERSRSSAGAAGSPRLSHLGMTSDRASAPGRENSELQLFAPPTADEGSRTGIKGSPLGGLLNTVQPSQTNGGTKGSPLGGFLNTVQPTHANGVSNGPGANDTPRRPKASGHSAGSDSMTASRYQFATPPSRQLTIFYGGEAHVFDEVPLDKITQIMQLAGATGRSWSSTYSGRQNTSVSNPVNEGSPSALERERNRNTNSRHAGAVQNEENLGLSTEVQALLRGLAQSGNGVGSAGFGHLSPDAAVPPLSNEMRQAISERLAANAYMRDNGRTAPRVSSCTDDITAKEALLQGGQRWL